MLKRRILKQILLAICVFISCVKPSFAWKGLDYENKTTIDIGPGNLVRTGKYIDFYDFKTDEVHNGKVLYMEETPAGTQLQIEDFDSKQERTFIMEESS